MKRSHAIPHVAPVTRAIRAVLAASALALATPVVAYADASCHTAPATAPACRADFRQAAAGFLAAPVVDLTVVEGMAPASVTASPSGIQAQWRGDDAFAASALDTRTLLAPTDIDVVDDITSVAASHDDVGTIAFGIASSSGSDIHAFATVENGTDIDVSGDGTVVGLNLFDAYSATLDNIADITVVANPDAYGQALAIGQRVNSHEATADNHGSIDASATSAGGYAGARGIDAFAYSIGTLVTNTGDVHATARADGGRARANGIYSFGYNAESNVDNAGTVEAIAIADGGGAYATAINSIGYGLDATVNNSGTLLADAQGAYAYGLAIVNFATRRNGVAAVDNTGAIVATASGGYATATGIINASFRYGSASVANSGTISASASGRNASSTGIYNYAYTNDASVDNTGTIDSTAIATAGAALATGIYSGSKEHAAVANAGDVHAAASSDADLALAWGVIVNSEQVSDLTNDGVIEVVAYAADGYALAAGAYALGGSVVTLRNYGSITATSGSGTGDASAYAAVAVGGNTGIGLLINGGDLRAEATVDGSGTATATGAFVFAEVATIYNDGTATAIATAGDGLASATGLGINGGFSALHNDGDVLASADADGGTAEAVGADSYGFWGSTFVNGGDILADARAIGGTASATGASSIAYAFSAYATNDGSITAQAEGEYATATGMLNASIYIGDAVSTNTGSIVAVADGVMDATAVGVYNFAYVYGSVIDNSGSIDATAITSYYRAAAIGAHARSVFGYGNTGITNTGSIDATAAAIDVIGYASATAWGAVVQSGPYGAAGIDNAAGASISATAYVSADFGGATATGAYVQVIGGDGSIVNHGDIDAAAVVGTNRGYAYSTGAQVLALYYGSEATLANYGSISAHSAVNKGFAVAYGARAYGYHASVTNAAGADITATAYTDVFGSAGAIGISAGAKYAIDVVNDGTIVAYAHAAHGYNDPVTGYTHFSVAGATGIYAVGGTMFTAGDASVTNHGDIYAHGVANDNLTFFNGLAGANGIRVLATQDASIENTGNIWAISETDIGGTGAYGMVASGRRMGSIVNHADALIVASATAGSLAGDFYGGRAFAMGAEVFGSFDGTIYNAGSIFASAEVESAQANPGISIAQAWGIEMRTFNTGTVVNLGDVHASARADFGTASAYGVRLPGNPFGGYSNNGAVSVDNSGVITAYAGADYGDAFAVGAYAYALHSEYIGCLPYGGGCQYEVTAGDTDIDNTGEIHALANAAGGVATAYGTVAIAAFNAVTTNAGHISAAADADVAHAVGSLSNSFYGDASLTNSGTIVAAAYGADASAIAVSMQSVGTNSLTNTGVIAALGDGVRVAVYSADGANAVINNLGTLSGAIRTGELGDLLDNGGGATWLAVGASDFGAGDDVIVNRGTVFMDDATIRLGDAGENDAFDNLGLLAVSGAANTIDFAGSSAFTNDGTITFIDGAADDVLIITGDFAGQGDLYLDVSGLDLAGDRLYIGGNVNGAAQTLNVNLLDVPESANMLIPLVNVSGDASADSFTLGSVASAQGGFLTLDFTLQADIDASNATDDVFSLGVAVSGLNGAGSLAAVLAPGAQSLVNSQVGTWRQRMGVVPASGKTTPTPWVRLFSDSGTVDAEHDGNFGAGGDFAFDQNNHGWELGVDVRATNHLALGVLVADTEGRQHLESGAGSANLAGRTFGLYGTWFADGFYVDASRRWTGIDATLHAGGEEFRLEATAATTNLEAGYAAWTIGGVHVVPQLQYTRTTVGDIGPLRDGASTFVDDGGTSSRLRLGVAFDTTFERAGIAWTPYGSLNAVRELDGDFDHAINGGLVGTTRTGGTSALLELGVAARKDKLTVTGGVHVADGGAQQGVAGGQVTVRYTW